MSGGVATAGPWTSLEPRLSDGTLSSIAALGFTSMTPVQARAIPLFLGNKDVVVGASTGSGKTLSYVIPIIEIITTRTVKLDRTDVGAIVILPTRELASQVRSVVDHFASRANVTTALLVGGSSSSADDLEWMRSHGCNVVVATPGRLLEVLNVGSKSSMNVRTLEVLVLDEGDRLLEMGFKVALSAIMERLPKQRRTGLFSATQTEDIDDLCRVGTRNPVTVRIDRERTESAPSSDGNSGSAGHSIPSTLVNSVMMCTREEKMSQLVSFLNSHTESKVLVYFLTCHCVDYFWRILRPLLKPSSRFVISLHGKAAAHCRTGAYADFVKTKNGVLLCTDVAARGLDIPDVDWIVQYDSPQDPKVFVHRIGRTARMGASGNALLFLDPSESAYVEFLRLRDVRLDPVDPDANAEDVLGKVKEMARRDRDVYLKSQEAFVSYVRAYREHQCSFIFRSEKLDLASQARGMGLIRMPIMSELKGKGKRPAISTGFVDEEMDFDSIPFLNKAKEKARVEKLGRTKAAVEDRTKERKAKAEKRQRAAEEKRKKEMASKPWTIEELEELAEDARLLKKRKKGKITDEELDEKLGLDDEVATQEEDDAEHAKEPVPSHRKPSKAFKPKRRWGKK